MRNLMANVVRILASMIRFVFSTVIEGGRAVLRLVAVKPEPPQENIIPSAEVTDQTELVKQVAAILASGRKPTAHEIGGLSDETCRWLRRLDQKGLCRLATAQPWLIREHIAGKTEIIHVAPYREPRQPIFKPVEQPAPQTERRTLRDILLKRGIHIAA